MISISLQNVSKKFDKTLAVDDVTLHIPAGELFFLLGPSGCGKTTCLRMIAGFYAPDAGQLKFGERVMNDVPPHKRNTGMVFQNYALWPHMTVVQNVEYGLKIRKMARAEREKEVKQALEMVQLTGLGDRYPSQMSGGQQQRVALARALVIRPDALLLDEPLSNLDARLRLEMREEIKRLHTQTGTTAVYVTHDQEEALSIADRIAVMKDGRLQQSGTPRELYRRPRSRFVAEFLGEANFVPGTVKARDGEHWTVATPCGDLQAAREDGVDFEIGARVWWTTRPENWSVQKQGGASPVNALRGVLQNVIYGGSREGWHILPQARESQSENIETLRVANFNPGAQTPAIGSEVEVWCETRDAWVLPRE